MVETPSPFSPTLATTAQKYLAIVATSTTSERLFSTAGNIITAKRSALSTENGNKLVFFYTKIYLNSTYHTRELSVSVMNAQTVCEMIQIL